MKVVAVVTLLVLVLSAAHGGLVNRAVVRTVDLTSQVAKIRTVITVLNDGGSAPGSYGYVVDSNASGQLFYIAFESTAGDTLSFKKTSDTCVVRGRRSGGGWSSEAHVCARTGRTT